jgi:hypothetical protein
MPAYCLRDLLAERIAAVPPGGTIDWVTYYFRDRMLAEELIRAHRQGIKITVTLERHPRTAYANEDVIGMLSGPNGLGEGFRTVSLQRVPTSPRIVRKPHLHEKLYCFSHPRPIAFIGSFNPSGNGPGDDPAIIEREGHRYLFLATDTAASCNTVSLTAWSGRADTNCCVTHQREANRQGLDTTCPQ